MSRSDALLAAAQSDAQSYPGYDQNDMIVDVVMVSVYRNFETGDEGVFISTSAPEGRRFPSYKAIGMLSEALDSVGGGCEDRDD